MTFCVPGQGEKNNGLPLGNIKGKTRFSKAGLCGVLLRLQSCSLWSIQTFRDGENKKSITFLIVMDMNDTFRYRLHIGSHSYSLRHSGEDIKRAGTNNISKVR